MDMLPFGPTLLLLIAAVAGARCRTRLVEVLALVALVMAVATAAALAVSGPSTGPLIGTGVVGLSARWRRGQRDGTAADRVRRLDRRALRGYLSRRRTGRRAVPRVAVPDAGERHVDGRRRQPGPARRRLDRDELRAPPAAAVLPRTRRGAARGTQEVHRSTRRRCHIDRRGTGPRQRLWHYRHCDDSCRCARRHCTVRRCRGGRFARARGDAQVGAVSAPRLAHRSHGSADAGVGAAPRRGHQRRRFPAHPVCRRRAVVIGGAGAAGPHRRLHRAVSAGW